MESTLNMGKNLTSIEQRSMLVSQVLSRKYISIAEVDLCTNMAAVVKSDEDTEIVGREMLWSELVERYANRRVCLEDRNLILSLTSDYLEDFLNSKEEERYIEVRCKSNTTYILAELAIVVVSVFEKRLLITTRNITKERMMQSIVDKYVFADMDYFFLLDASRNSYTMFSGKNNGLPIPPEYCADYTDEMIRYNKHYVMPEEQARVIDNMMIPHVLLKLEEERYSFVCSAKTDDGIFCRIRIQYQYYDRNMGLILLTRTDITQIFLEEQAKHRQLAEAIRDAQHDALTDIFNQKATSGLVASALESRYWNQAAFLFIDIDNFKMVNDTLGHQTGDSLLQLLANYIRKLAGHDGIAGRVGGDEFLLFLPADSGMKSVERCALQICEVFESLKGEICKNIPISCSVGISVYPKDGTSYDVLVRKADQALYTSKRYGKNRFDYYSQTECK